MSDPIGAARDRFARVAIAHEWLTIPGGSEQVVEAMLELFPRAEIFTSVYDRGAFGPPIADRRVHVSFLDRVPRARRIYPRLLPLMDAAFRSFDLGGFDLVLSSNHACAKNVRPPDDALHVCYCHTPMRYAWDSRFLAGEDLGAAERLGARLLLPMLRRQDRAAAAGPHRFLANSSAVAERIRRFYGRSAVVLPPPVDVEALLRTPRGDGDYYLFLSRVVPYKRADLAVQACTRLGRPLKVAGDGRALARVRAVAGPDVEFLGHVAAGELPGLLAGASALLFPAEEDFGIVAVEAQAAGVPVIAYGQGGSRDTILDGVTGLLFEPQTAEALAEAIVAFERRSWDEAAIRDNARRFARERFLDGLARAVVDAAAADRPTDRIL